MERLGLFDRKLSVTDPLVTRLFPARVKLPKRWMVHYRRLIDTRRIPRCRRQELRYAF